MTRTISRYFHYHTLPRFGEYMKRDEMDQVIDWLNHDAQGVCFVVGGFGAGKTTLLDEFIQTSLKRKSPSQPDRSVFTYSFEIGNSSERCLSGIYEWLTGKNVSNDELAEQLSATLKGLTRPVLIVLDALEKALDGSDQDESGSLLFSSKILRTLINEAVTGGFPNAGWLISSRHLPSEICENSAVRFGFSQKPESEDFRRDYEFGESNYLEVIPVRALGEKSSLEILDRFGLKGTVGAKRELVKKCDFHAQTIVLSAGYIRAFCDADLENSNLSTAPIGDLEVDKSKYPVYGTTFERNKLIVERYFSSLNETNPVALEVMQAMAILRSPLPLSLVHSAFCSSSATGLLKGLDLKEFKNALRLLVELELLTPIGETWLCHSGIRASINFLCKKHKVKELHRLLGHQMLMSVTEHYEDDSQAEHLLVELIFHLAMAGDLSRATKVLTFLHRSLRPVRGYASLVRAAEPVLGLSSPRKIRKPKSISKLQFIQCLNSYCCGLQADGRIQEANFGFQRILKETSEEGIDFLPYTRTAHVELCANLIEIGRFASAAKAIEKRRKWAESLTNIELGSAEETAFHLRKMEARFVEGGKLKIAFYTGCFAEAAHYLKERAGFSMDSLCWLGAPSNRGEEEYLERLMADLEVLKDGRVLRAIETFLSIGMLERAKELLMNYVPTSATYRLQHRRLTAATLIKDALIAKDSREKKELCAVAHSLLCEAKRLAAVSGFGKENIDVLVALAELHELNGEFPLAIECAEKAMFGEEQSLNDPQALNESSDPAKRGFFTQRELGMPAMLAATHVECNYVIGEIKARMVLARVLIPKNKFTQLAVDKGCLSYAVENLLRVIKVCERLTKEAPNGILPREYLEAAKNYHQLITSGDVFYPANSESIEEDDKQTNKLGVSLESNSISQEGVQATLQEMQRNRPATYHAYMSFLDVQNRIAIDTAKEAFRHINNYYDELGKDLPSESAWKKSLGRAKKELGESRKYERRGLGNAGRSAIPMSEADRNYFGS